MHFSKMMQRKVVLVFILVALLAGMTVQSASAALRTCRTDPIVFLSDGHKVSLSVTMATDAANVSQIRYVLHVPSGVTVTNVVFTGGEMARKEMIMVWADLPPNTYKSATSAHTHAGIVDVSATTMLLVGVSGTAYGKSGDTLEIELTDPNNSPRREFNKRRP